VGSIDILFQAAAQSRPTTIVEWAEREFVIAAEPGMPSRPIVLEPHQKAILRHAFTPNDKGKYPYTTVIYSASKKSGKTTIAALVMGWAADTWPGPVEIFSCANDEEQAISRAFENVQELVRGNQRISNRTVAIKKAIQWSNGSKIQVLSGDYAGAAGAQRQALVVFDELWGYSSEGARRLYDELTPIPTMPISLRFISTYAGYLGEAKLLWEIYERVVKRGEKVPPAELEGLDLPCYRNETSFAYWDSYETAGEACHRMAWQQGEDGEAYYASQERELRPNAFRRLHWNMWTSNEDSFLTPEVWNACVDPDHRPLVAPDKSIILDLGVDASIRHDQASVVGVTYRDFERQVVLAKHRIFKPSPSDPLDLEDTLEATILEWWKNYTVRAVYYDPYQFHRSATTLLKIGVPMIEYPQSPSNLTRMGQNLYELLTHKNLVLYPDDELKIAATRAVAIESTRGWRIAKEKSADKIDPLIALAHAAIGAINTLTDRAVEAEPHFDYDKHVYKPKEKAVSTVPKVEPKVVDDWAEAIFHGSKPVCNASQYPVLRPMMIEALERFAKTKDPRGMKLMTTLEEYDQQYGGT